MLQFNKNAQAQWYRNFLPDAVIQSQSQSFISQEVADHGRESNVEQWLSFTVVRSLTVSACHDSSQDSCVHDLYGCNWLDIDPAAWSRNVCSRASFAKAVDPARVWPR